MHAYFPSLKYQSIRRAFWIPWHSCVHVKATEWSMIKSDHLCGLHGGGEGTPHQSSSPSMATKLERKGVDQRKRTRTIKYKATWLSIQTSEFTGVLGAVPCSWAQRQCRFFHACSSPGCSRFSTCSILILTTCLRSTSTSVRKHWPKATWGGGLYHGREVKSVRA